MASQGSVRSADDGPIWTLRCDRRSSARDDATTRGPEAREDSLVTHRHEVPASHRIATVERGRVQDRPSDVESAGTHEASVGCRWLAVTRLPGSAPVPPSARRFGRPRTSASSRGGRPSARAATASRPARARRRRRDRRAGRTAAGSSRRARGPAGCSERSSSRGSSWGTRPTARSNNRTKTTNEASQSRRAASSVSLGMAAAAADRGLGGLRLQDSDDRVALADLALGDDPPEPLPVVPHREIGRAGRPAAAHATRLRDALDDAPRFRLGEGEAGGAMATGRAPRGPRAR